MSRRLALWSVLVTLLLAARAEAPADPNLTRLALATVRGLLLDLVGTQDRKAVDAAADTFVRLLRCADHIP